MLKSLSFLSRCTYKTIEFPKLLAHYTQHLQQTPPPPPQQQIQQPQQEKKKKRQKSRLLKLLEDPLDSKKPISKKKQNNSDKEKEKEIEVYEYCGKPFSISKVRYAPISMENQIKLFFIALKRCGGSTIGDIYKINYKDFIKSPQGQSIFYLYGGSIIRMCYTLFPNFEWAPWLFNKNTDLAKLRKQEGYDFQKEILWYAAKQNIKESNLDDWYNVRLVKLLRECKIPKGLLCARRLTYLIQKAYPHHKFYLFKFHGKSKWWDDPNNVSDFRQYLFKETKFTTMEQFYLLSRAKISKMGAYSLLYYLNHDLYKFYCLIFPDYPWKEEFLAPRMSLKLTTTNYDKKPTISDYLHLPTTKKKIAVFPLPEKEAQQQILETVKENLK
ncbi:hypothetical protein ACTFIU_011561 [Dictyostelium citrinum]